MQTIKNLCDTANAEGVRTVWNPQTCTCPSANAEATAPAGPAQAAQCSKQVTHSGITLNDGLKVSELTKENGYTSTYWCCVGGAPERNQIPKENLTVQIGECTRRENEAGPRVAHIEQNREVKYKKDEEFSKNSSYKASAFVGEGPCKYTDKIMEGVEGKEEAKQKYDCAKGQSKFEKTQQTVMAGTAIGTTLVNMQGAASRTQAQGSQAAAVGAAAKTAETAANAQTIAGAFQIYSAMQMNKLAKQYNQNAAQLTKETDKRNIATHYSDVKAADLQGLQNETSRAHLRNDGTADGNHGYLSSRAVNGDKSGRETDFGSATIKQFELNSAKFGTLDAVPACQQISGAPNTCSNQVDIDRAVQARIKKAQDRGKDAGEEMAKIGGRAASEQKVVANVAKGQFMSNLVSGLTQFANAQLARATAANLKEAAKDLQVPAGGNGGVTFAGRDPFADGGHSGGGSAGVIDGSDVAVANAGAEEIPSPGPGAEDSLGDALGGSGDIAAGPPGPVPGEFSAAPGGGRGGGGGGGGIGGGSTSASTGESEKDPQSSYAGITKSPDRYDGGGGGRPQGGGSADSGPDLSGLLAQFLPKEKDAGPPEGILEFGSRGPAASEPESLLDPSVNLFERVHQAYQDKNRKGRVGR